MAGIGANSAPVCGHGGLAPAPCRFGFPVGLVAQLAHHRFDALPICLRQLLEGLSGRQPKQRIYIPPMSAPSSQLILPPGQGRIDSLFLLLKHRVIHIVRWDS
jgi:hypothetical protein